VCVSRDRLNERGRGIVVGGRAKWGRGERGRKDCMKQDEGGEELEGEMGVEGRRQGTVERM